MSDLEKALRVATAAAQAAGELIRRDSWRPDGPRGEGHHADVDDEAEALIRGRLLQAFPDWSYYGEETGLHVAADPGTFWLVDPNDGTHAYLRGYRASTVSIALIRGGLPVLGVVYAPCFPDDEGDLVAWAEGCGPLRRNGRPVELAPPPSRLGPDHVVLVSHAADGATEANLACCAPSRFRALPSIAYRLALVAVGEADAAVSHGGPGWLDIAGGHALLRSRGGEVTDRGGHAVRYPSVGSERLDMCFGAALPVCEHLGRSPWEAARGSHKPPSPLIYPVRLRTPRRPLAPGLLSRAQGCLLGLLAGDALGGLVGHASPAAIRAAHGTGPRALADGGPLRQIGGQPTAAGELALAVARVLLDDGQGHVVQAGLRARLGEEAAPPLAAVAPLALAAASPDAAAAWARALGPPEALAAEGRELVARAVSVGLAGGSRDEMYRAALQAATHLTRDALERASFAPPPDFERPGDDPRVALHNAFYRLLDAPSLEEGVVDTVREGGNASLHASLAGALLGAHHGRPAVPGPWMRQLLSCRATPAFAATCRPRPPWCWPVDALEIAERLLCLGG